MGTTEYKRVWNFFTIAQWEEEELWLNEMARNGWNLVRIDYLVRYVFERGSAGEYIYKLDLPDKTTHGIGDAEYCNFLAECGITMVCKQKQWLFLRKRAADGPFNSSGDMFAKLKMTNKANDYALRTLSMLLRIFTAIILIASVGQIAASNNFALSEMLSGIIYGISISALIAITIIWLPIINRLRKKMNALIDEIGIKN